jgi:hypothetical protein
MARESIMEKVSAPKKKIQGFPHVFTLENFKTALTSNVKQ